MQQSVMTEYSKVVFFCYYFSFQHHLHHWSLHHSLQSQKLCRLMCTAYYWFSALWIAYGRRTKSQNHLYLYVSDCK